MRVESLDLRAVIEHAIETVLPFAKPRRHQIKSIPDLPGDAARRLCAPSQVIANLLNNAAKYTEEGGVIDVPLAATLPAKPRSS